MIDSGARTGLPRVFEVPAALVSLIVVLPILAVAGVAIKASSRGPVLFRQVRVGRNGILFIMLKLRTMRQTRKGTEITAEGDSRITRFGRVLRKLKMDELPELWNVVRGDLSLVGPRPEVPAYVDLEDPRWREVLGVRPGITDPVTLRLRNEEELMARADGDVVRFYLDVVLPYKLDGYVDYLRRRTAWSDLWVLIKTALVVVLPGQAPPPTLDEVSEGWR